MTQFVMTEEEAELVEAAREVRSIIQGGAAPDDPLALESFGVFSARVQAYLLGADHLKPFGWPDIINGKDSGTLN